MHEVVNFLYVSERTRRGIKLKELDGAELICFTEGLMNEIKPWLLQIHIYSGTLSIIFFWVIIYFKKGERLHKFLGQAYTLFMAILCLTTILMCLLVLKFGVFAPTARLHLFLLAAGLIAFVPAHTAIWVSRMIHHKSFPNYSYHLLVNSVALLFGLALGVYAIFAFYIPMAILCLFVYPHILIPIITRLLKLKSKQSLNPTERLAWHIKIALQSGGALHVGFLAGGNTTKYLNNQYMPETIVVAMFIIVILIAWMEKRFIRNIQNFEIPS